MEFMEREDVFRALAHPVRRRIVTAAADKACSFQQLMELTGRGDTALSGHLRILREAKVIRTTRSGRAILYTVNRRVLRPGTHWMTRISSPDRGHAKHPR